MSSDDSESAASSCTQGSSSAASAAASDKDKHKEKEKARVNRTSLILWHAHQNDAVAVRKLLEEDRSLVHARDYDKRTPLHVASLHGWTDIAKCLIDYGADVNAQDRWKNTVFYFILFFKSELASKMAALVSVSLSANALVGLVFYLAHTNAFCLSAS